MQTNVGGGQGYLNNRCGGASSFSTTNTTTTTTPNDKNANIKNNVRQWEGSSTGWRSVDDEIFFYTANGLNQYTSIEDMSWNKVLMDYDKNWNLIENDEFLVTNQISPKWIMRNYCVGSYTFFNQKYKKYYWRRM
jgi:hypothetical protein